MGDPGLQLWTDTPTQLNAEFNSSVSWGTNFIDVEVIDDNTSRWWTESEFTFSGYMSVMSIFMGGYMKKTD